MINKLEKGKVKVLVTELYHHPKVLENIFHLLHDRTNLSFYIIRDKMNSYAKLFPSMAKAEVSFPPIHSAFFFLFLLFKAHRYDYINISTGPEHSHYSDILNVICFYILTLAYSHKIILTIKNSKQYLTRSDGIFSFFRSKAIKNIKRFTFETQTQMTFFKNAVKRKNAYFGTSYDRYSDISTNFPSSSFSLSSENIQIGLLGAIDIVRRDYNIICGALDHLSVNERNKLSFNILGACKDGVNNAVIKKIAYYVKINFFEYLLSEETFFNVGKKCDVLISPLNNSKEYGTFNGTGSIGDALYLRKKLLIPKFTDPLDEFKDIFLCYTDEKSLVKILRRLVTKENKKIPKEYFQKFSTEMVFKRLITDLNLQK